MFRSRTDQHTVSQHCSALFLTQGVVSDNYLVWSPKIIDANHQEMRRVRIPVMAGPPQMGHYVDGLRLELADWQRELGGNGSVTEARRGRLTAVVK
jgi:hypothetical protein